MSNVMDLTGRHALVCGASKGIGRAASLALAELGAGLTLLARSRAQLEAVAAEARTRGAPVARVLVADLDDREGFTRQVREHLTDHGPAHIVVHNTGGPPGGLLVDASPEALLAAFNRHVLTAQVLLQLTLPGMREAGYGRYLNVLSTSVREPIDNLGVSNTIRAAMAGWAKTLSRELPPGVTINNVLPGYTDTQRLSSLAEAVGQRTQRTAEEVLEAWSASVPEGRLGRPEELGAVIAFLASPAAAYIRGASLPVDGGRLRSI